MQGYPWAAESTGIEGTEGERKGGSGWGGGKEGRAGLALIQEPFLKYTDWFLLMVEAGTWEVGIHINQTKVYGTQ